ncbi:hypothetical protein PHYSODRAFT_262776 [Phytophthora sojae]|uniref:Uncharacterized protein n=1 Tax=Phytophthora sojae (strain P6497) TaxID=1094619 RepID=G4ZV62_PHYSP|nr:hypothetical protein PHYSODRAFT_335428 [Phytophthora sojae]XP_009531113.1 hypothetical protein PHYSODRAFT_335430 [Phytophthora sojae]XP_009531114.1 hypothetical protein PHYSODRAFT_335431 [Phytophthora sojae]XP_009531115.1 hypothetical protein PHYSODRAFT_262776 [Phytophthora sojae]EGZ13682.1 hypothetical protein PHYSODRAFT_335428 [Phytophthora sojae]EGZ13684.1 hypothetical protein PHYSODRAFT_335430 [Phytophthora sojae]EGZ13685.1 hypothetical protein PHYSODRAFT_335431 [Phytophthora sojae]EG|eukprot:XP_009531111.1 hypothetical protein PHYSODRAFT_335428 [Phytophthora sojae]
MKCTTIAVAAVLATAGVVAAESPALRALADAPKVGTVVATATGPAEATDAQPTAGEPKDKKEWGWGGSPWGWGGGWGRPWGCGGAGWGGGWGWGGGVGCGGGWGW